MNVAANLLMEDSKVEIQEIALKMGYRIVLTILRL